MGCSGWQIWEVQGPGNGAAGHRGSQGGFCLWSETGGHQRRPQPRGKAPGWPAGLTLRQGLSVWAPSRLNPFPGWNWPPTAKAMRVE